MKTAATTRRPPTPVRKWAGVLSLVWLALVPLLFKLFPRYFYFHIFSHDRFEWLGVTALVAWWPVALLLAICGLCSRSRLGRGTGLFTILGFVLFLFWFVVVPRLTLS